MAYERDTVQLVFFLRRRKNMSVEEFYQYWKDTHGPLVVRYASVLGIRRYAQIRTLSQFSQALAERNGLVVEQFDGVAEISYDARVFYAPRTFEQVEAADALLRDERNFIELSHSPLQAGKEYLLWDEGQPVQPSTTT